MCTKACDFRLQMYSTYLVPVKEELGDRVRGNALRCESGEVVRAMSWRKF